MNILEIHNLRTSFTTRQGKIVAADDVSLCLPKGKITALVGESGSGKSVTAMSVLRLIQPPGKIEAGRILLGTGDDQQDLLALSEERMRTEVRGRRIAMIFQEPMTSLNPVYPIGDQIMEVIAWHQHVSGIQAKAMTVDLLERVGIPQPEARIHNYPHEMSGGMRQRVMIAMGLSCQPDLLIADEPTTALDVTIQAQILELIKKLVDETGMSVLLITHDLGIVASYASKVAVMYAGQIVEEAETFSLFKEAQHPYTKGLLASIPRLKGEREKRLHSIPGMVPSLLSLPSGCRFQDRCERKIDACVQGAIPMVERGERKCRCLRSGPKA